MIYFDNAATTKVDADVLKAYIGVCQNYYANPSSPHIFAKKTENLFLRAKRQIIKSLGLSDNYKLIMTSGATEANNLAIVGYVLAHLNKGNRIICTRYEHSSVLSTFEYLKTEYGIMVDYLDVDQNGHINFDQLNELMNEKTILVSIMAVNNEIGSINDINTIGKIIHDNSKAAFHCDASQSIGKVNLNYQNCDLITISSHKIYGLKGCGGLIIKNNIIIRPLAIGGGQEDGLRSGTNDVASTVAFAVAIKKVCQNYKSNFQHVLQLFNYLFIYLSKNTDLYEINSCTDQTPYILNFSLKNKKASVVTEALSMNDVMVSTSSACSSKKEAYSQSVKSLGKSTQIYQNTIRVSFSKDNTLEEVKQFIDILSKVMKEIKS